MFSSTKIRFALHCFLLSLAGFASFFTQAVNAQYETKQSETDSMLAMLRHRVEDRPDHADSWRLLGKYYAKLQWHDQAANALERSLELDPENAAAHFDMAELHSWLSNPHLSIPHYQKVLLLAPDSVYAQQTRALGIRSPRSQSAEVTEYIGSYDPNFNVILANEFLPASYEIETFEGTGVTRQATERTETELVNSNSNQGANQKRNLIANLELGALFNSNVSLTPISRELVRNDVSSAQLVFNPDFQYTIDETGTERIGLIGRGFFSVNESNFQELNLSSIQPGLFLERDHSLDGQAINVRAEYGYSIDRLGGSQVGDRHSLTLSATCFRQDGNIDFLFGSFSNSDFQVDGVFPEVTSLDGDAWTVGASRFYLTGRMRIPLVSFGATGENADTEGADARYQSIRLQGDLTVLLNEKWSLYPTVALGHRWYSDFTQATSRDEFTWRTDIELRRQLNANLYLAFVFDFSRFDSGNPDFDVDRYRTGILTRWRY